MFIILYFGAGIAAFLLTLGYMYFYLNPTDSFSEYLTEYFILDLFMAAILGIGSFIGLLIILAVIIKDFTNE